ncbi:MAG: cysteine desulfurase NifS [Defluviitaleaceae bacterium]|nr:cysteine desulfurase NifS [Defluviitaleaceae bacterium]
MSELIYMDNAGSTRVRQEVIEAMQPIFNEVYANPSSTHSLARKAKACIKEAREQVAKVIGANPREIFFTSGGTEADNWAIQGVVHANAHKGKHIITSTIEHPGILTTCRRLEKMGCDVTYLPVTSEGLVRPEDLKAAIRPDTVLITIMFVNNEVGTIQPIAELGRIAREHGIPFHTDAVQAVGHIPVDVEAQNIDMLSLSGHKFYAPKGIGALYIKKGTKIESMIFGGGHERGMRAGTENAPNIVALGKAIELAALELDSELVRLTRLRDRLTDGILSRIPHTILNGSHTQRSPGITNISFEYIEGESLLLLLDHKGIAASSGSACASGSLDPSHVLLAMGIPHEKAHGSLRMSLGRYNTEAEVDTVIETLIPIVSRLREMSPTYPGN